MISIITNFGCHWECPYCVVKNNGLQIPKTTVESLQTLDKMLYDYDEEYISISGGGDPLFNYRKHQNYYDRLFEIAEKHVVKLELHTSIFDPEIDYSSFDTVCFHISTIEEMIWITHCLDGVVDIVRFVYVVDENLKEETILSSTICLDMINSRYSKRYQLSFRQMINDKYETMYYHHDLLLDLHDRFQCHYIQQDDYNDYFVNGVIYKKFSDIGKSEGE